MRHFLPITTAILAVLCSSSAAPYNYPYTIGFIPSTNPFAYQQPLGYHSNAFHYPSPQNVVVWTVVGHDGKTIFTGPVQDQKTEQVQVVPPSTDLDSPPPPQPQEQGPAEVQHDDNEAVVIEDTNQNQIPQQPSLALQVPAPWPGQYVPFGLPQLPTIGWIPNIELIQPSTELQVPGSGNDEAVIIEGDAKDDETDKPNEQPDEVPVKDDDDTTQDQDEEKPAETQLDEHPEDVPAPPGPGKEDEKEPEPADDDKPEDDDDTIKIDLLDGPPASDETINDFETKMAESNPDENETTHTRPVIEDIHSDDVIDVAPEEKPVENKEVDGDGDGGDGELREANDSSEREEREDDIKKEFEVDLEGIGNE